MTAVRILIACLGASHAVIGLLLMVGLVSSSAATRPINAGGTMLMPAMMLELATGATLVTLAVVL